MAKWDRTLGSEGKSIWSLFWSRRLASALAWRASILPSAPRLLRETPRNRNTEAPRPARAAAIHLIAAKSTCRGGPDGDMDAAGTQPESVSSTRTLIQF